MDKKREEAKVRLSKTRFLEVSKFKGKTLISIRDYYEGNRGKLRHSKKGISLTLQQWTTMLENVEKINSVIDPSLLIFEKINSEVEPSLETAEKTNSVPDPSLESAEKITTKLEISSEFTQKTNSVLEHPKEQISNT